MARFHRMSLRLRNQSRPRLESLEGRQLMSLGSEFAATVNTTTANIQANSANASSSNGSSVVVWADSFSATDRDIRAQLYNSSGNKIGSEISVSSSGYDERTPAVAMDKNGNFVVTWTQALPGGDTDVVARRFNSAGASQGSIVPVGTGTFREHDPSIAMDDRGEFVVAYTRDTNNNNPDVFAKKYDANNVNIAVLNVATSNVAEDNASIAMTPDGRFDVAWEQTYNVNDHDVFLNQYDATTSFIGLRAIATTTATETLPSVSMDKSGNAVVAWQRTSGGNADVLARRVKASGTLGKITTIAATSYSEGNPSVAIKRKGGSYVVAFDGTVAGSPHVQVAEVSSSDKVKTFDAGYRISPAISINAADHYLLTYTANDAGDLNIRRRIGHL